MQDQVVILGCGYTGRRVAAVLRERVSLATTRHGRPGTLAWNASTDVSFVPEGARVLYSVPTADEGDPTPAVIAALAERRPTRIVYLSTTSVYGAAHEVDEQTPVAPRTASEWARVRAEEAVLSAGCSAMVLRPAAIYGPGRGIHVKMQAGAYRLGGAGENYVSRIYVEDLAAISVAALFSGAGGAWPVADEEPCRSREIAEFCSKLMGLPMPPAVPVADLHSTRRADRRVNGRAVLRTLGLRLGYPSYRQGIPAALASSGSALP